MGVTCNVIYNYRSFMSDLHQKNNTFDVQTNCINKYTWTVDNGLECSSSNYFMVTNSYLKKNI